MTTTQIQKAEPKGLTEYQPLGSTDSIKLSVSLVQTLIAEKTKTGQTCSERDAVRFIAMCRAKRLNPFEGDAFLLGYDTKEGPRFSLITAHQAFLKRAEMNPEFDGMESGIILLGDEGEVTEREGDFHLPNEAVVGGWARVFFKNRSHPTYRRVRTARFQKSFGVWQDDAAGMSCKCAEADALRSAFPTMLGGLYMQAEIETEDSPTKSPQARSRTLDLVSVAPLESETVPIATAEPPVASASTPAAPERSVPAPRDEPQSQLSALVTENGYTFAQFQTWGMRSGNIADADSMSGFDDIPSDVCTRLLRARSGLLSGLKMVKDGVA